MAQVIRIRRASASGTAPASLAVGEIAINEFDGKLFTRTGAGAIRSTDLNEDALKAALSAQVLASATAADTNILALTIPANQLRAGTQFSIDAMGNSDNVATAGTLSIWLKVGTVKIATLAIATPATAQTLKGWHATFMLTVRSIGASGTVICAGSAKSAAPSTYIAALPFSIATTPTTVDTTAAQTITVGMSWAAAVSGNIGRCDHANIVLVKL